MSEESTRQVAGGETSVSAVSSAVSAERVLSDVRYRSFKALRLFCTVLGLPNMIIALASAAAADRIEVLAVLNAAVISADGSAVTVRVIHIHIRAVF